MSVIGLIDSPSPNWSPRPMGARVSLIVLHNTAGRMPGCLAWLRNQDAKASAHYLVTRKGAVHRLVSEDRSAWHAMQANSRSIGIEIEAYGGAEGMTEPQEAVLRELIADIRKRYKLGLNAVMNHRQVNPGRTQCPVLIWPTDNDFNNWKNTLEGENKA